MIEGVALTPLKQITHPKGKILHALKRSSPGFAGFGEAYFSTVLSGEIKGWKRHRRATLNLVVPVGRIRFVIHDDRGESRTQGHFEEVTLGEDCYFRLTVVPGLWVAFKGERDQPSLLLNIIDEEHDPSESDNKELQDFSFNW
jgi:dTDP-4-dehydrorhamnose 3,5-epimerase